MRADHTGGKFARLYRKVTWSGMALTAVLFVSHYFLPDRQIVLFPSEQHSPNLYGFDDGNIGKFAYWINQQNNHWVCDAKSSADFGCGWLLNFNSTGMDISDFEELRIELNYQGPASRLRLFMRNFDPAYSALDDSDSLQAVQMSIPIADASEPIKVDLNEFYVASWWLLERESNRQRAKTKFNGITTIGVDLVEPGKHQVKIERIAVVGRWVKTESLLTALLSFWMSVFLLEGLVRFIQLYRTTRRNRQTISDMEKKQQMLAEENKQLETVANTDPLTGIYNRAGLQERIDSLLSKRRTLAGLRVMLMDIDHFKRLNDVYGHDMGDRVLRTFASLLAMNLRENDIFARLGGEEFVVVSQTRSHEGPHAFAEKLRQLALHCTFNGDSQLNISISIGVSTVTSDEDFSAALKRADNALYKAKQSGRNRVEYEPEI